MKATFALTTLLLLSAPALADTLRVPVGQQAPAQTQLERPGNGMSKERVLAQFGEPSTRQEAVGEPPIARWEYRGFVVYFEGNTVLHSVLKHQPQTAQ